MQYSIGPGSAEHQDVILEESSQDNIFPESKANLFTQFGQAADLAQFHEKNAWEFELQVCMKKKYRKRA